MTDDTEGPIEGLLRDASNSDIEKEESDIFSETEIPERSIKEMLEGTGELPGERIDVLAPPPLRKKRSLGIG